MMFSDREDHMSSGTLIRFARAEQAQQAQPSPATYSVQPGSRRSTSVTYRGATPTRIERRRQRTRTYAEDPFRARFGRRLPTGMRQEARGMAWREFVATYAPGRIRVDGIRSVRRAAGRHDIDLAVTGLRADGHGTRAAVTAMGTVSAVTQVLGDHGRPVEILEFHQYEIFEATVTFLYTVHGTTRVWAVGFGADRDLSIAAALANAASRLHP
ncbi:hypothetical protein [Corynebacterium bovis]|uniref:hypothetical protein n=2 Tax=Corynebacterium bovis TaxID=36808 RepID=UPI000F6460F8|nr:hypothetical protein [Corynebacterium bovis]MDK8510063.1 hypothetical protein [Corynebacterium bovis]RRO80668.1 hypothetical protein CXF38_05975 [Corynebacterium bovis]RRO82824.1 hypothetical protein CXF36_04980 [Corynebacterium bovis]RRO84130.1 hypothetical protein CXF37_03935 [Corynebacterium bovis]RRO91963.1 hypothetical protein CXF45_02415 [Corynebacterium bovis]